MSTLSNNDLCKFVQVVLLASKVSYTDPNILAINMKKCSNQFGFLF